MIHAPASWQNHVSVGSYHHLLMLSRTQVTTLHPEGRDVSNLL
jgi:hypothetical protein